ARPGRRLLFAEGLANPVPLPMPAAPAAEAEEEKPEGGKAGEGKAGKEKAPGKKGEGARRQMVDLRELPALARVQGSALEGLLYARPFTFFFPEEPGRVVLGDYVTVTEGTGLVHTAPPFGEDDYQTGVRYGLPLILSVDAEGKMAPGAGPFAGL